MADMNVFEKLDETALWMILNKLPTKDAVTTSFLSRQWRDQWRYLSNIVVKEFSRESFELFLASFISGHRRNKIDKFHVEFNYLPDQEDQVNAWMWFAVTKEVEDLNLDAAKDEDKDPLYHIPGFVFHCKSLVSLTLKGCLVELTDSANLPDLPNLRTLSLTLMEVGRSNGRTIRKLASMAPQLERLSLVNCMRNHNLNVDVSRSPRLKELSIIETKFDVARSNAMEILAPTVEKLIFLYASPRKDYHIHDVSNCTEFIFAQSDQPHEYLWKEVKAEFLPLRYYVALLDLLPHFRHVKVLRICNWCVQSLYKAEVYLTRKYRISLFCTTLEINTSFQRWELPGVTYLIKACPAVQDLSFVMAPKESEIFQLFLRENDFEERSYWSYEAKSLVAHHLRILKTMAFKLPGARYHSVKLWPIDLRIFFKDRENGIELVRALQHRSNKQLCIILSTDKQHRIFGNKQRVNPRPL